MYGSFGNHDTPALMKLVSETLLKFPVARAAVIQELRTRAKGWKGFGDEQAEKFLATLPKEDTREPEKFAADED